MTQLEDYLINKIEKMLINMEQNEGSKMINELKLPLIRLKIENSNFPVIKSKRLIDHFINKIANPMDFLQFYKKSGFIAGLNSSK